MSTIRACIVKNSNRIRIVLKKRFEELGLNNSQIIKDARIRGRGITDASLGRFINHGNTKSTMSQEDVIWLCIRYGIEIQLLVGSPKVYEGKIKLVIPPYNEANCLKYIERFFNILKDEPKQTEQKHTSLSMDGKPKEKESFDNATLRDSKGKRKTKSNSIGNK